MPAAEDRQARALEGMERAAREANKIMATLNENIVAMFKYLKEAIEKDQEYVDTMRAASDGPNQMSIDDLRAQAEKAQQEREERAASEARPTGEGVE